MNKVNIFSSYPELELPKCLDKWCTLDISYSSTQFDNTGIRGLVTTVGRTLCHILYPRLYGIGYMGDDLNCFAKVITTSFSFDYLGVDLTCGDVMITFKTDIEKSFVISEVKVDFAAVVEHENFAVFEWTHGASIAVQIRVNFHRSDSQSSAF